MEPCWLDGLKRWFDAYTSRFFGPDEYVNLHLRLKLEHTRRTCGEILYLAERLALSDNDRRIAETIGLLHDIGRFPQFARYRTYSDVLSVDHGALGAEVLQREGVLETLEPHERQWVLTAVARHGQKSLPADLNGQALLFLKLIRDADKLDIYRTAIQLYRQYRADPTAEFWWKLELPDDPWVSAVVLETAMNGQLIEHGMLQTLSDMMVCKLNWVYDMNFAISLARLRAQGSLEQLLALLPATPEIERLGEKILAYVDARTHQGVG